MLFSVISRTYTSVSLQNQVAEFFRRSPGLIGPTALRPLMRLQTFFCRLWLAVLEEFRNGRLTLQAASLVYTTLLSLVPLIAVVFSVLKAFDVQQAMEPLLARALEPLGPQGAEITARIIEFVSNLRVGVLGALGVAGLFYTVFSLIGQIEDALNYMWRVRRSRSIARKFSDYFSVVLVGPVLVFTALALTASAQSYWLMQRVLAIESLGFVVTLVTRVMPFVLLCIIFTALYKLIPHTQVRFSSALVGGVTAGILWQLVGAGFTAFVAGSANYKAIYSSFAILIIFLIWIYVAWLVVLIGGKVAYVYQYPFTYLAGGPWGRHGYVFRAWLALSALAEITRRHLTGEPPWRLAELASSLNVGVASLEEIIDDFIRRGLLFRTVEPEGLVPGRPPEQVKVSEILSALDGTNPDDTPAPTENDDPISRLLHRRDRAIQQAFEGVTLRFLASEMPALDDEEEVSTTTGESDHVLEPQCKRA